MASKDRAAFFRERLPIYRKDPVKFCEEVTNFYPEPYQRDMLMDLARSPKVTVKSGHGIGKTATEANAVLWFLSCFPYARVVATAPTAQQLNDVLWAELNKWIGKSPLLQTILHWTKTYVFVDGFERRWFAVAKTASKPENMQGFHEDNMLFIVDEASGVSDEIMEAVLATLSGGNNKLLMCGNPTRTTGTFYDSFHKDRALYKAHTVSSLDSKRTNKENIEMFKRKYGEFSNVYKVRVLGEFPTQEDDVFIPLPLIEQSINTELDPEQIDGIRLGVDVARYGDDETVIVQNVGGAISIPVIRHGQNLMSTVGDIVITYRKLLLEYPKYRGQIIVNIDDTGLGGGVTDRLEEVKREERLRRMEIVPVNFGRKAPNDALGEHYGDITTYMWATVKVLMEQRKLALCNDEELVAQLSVRKYFINSSGKIILERKKDMKERGIKSPDRADALALSCFTQAKIYGAFNEKTEAIVIPLEAIAAMSITQVNIGISVGSSIRGTSMVATAIIAGHRRAVVLSAKRYDAETEPDAISRKFVEFAKSVEKIGRRLDYVYCDDGEVFLYRIIKNAADQNNIPIKVRQAANGDVTNRIRLTTTLLTQNRLFLSEDCEDLTRAFATATWTDKRTKDARSDASDIGTLNAFEYTIEREASRFINTEQGG